MDRNVAFIGSVPRDVDILNLNKNTMVALGYLMQATLGTSVSVDGLACSPTTPASMTVNVSPGAIHSLQNVDNTAYGSLPADTTNQVMKQGINPATVNLSCPAPATTGQSVVYLVQAAYQDTDSGTAVLPYYNAADPNTPWSGPNNTGVSQNTVRKGVCLVGVKAGVAATTGSQIAPAPDAGYTGLYAVTVANGQSTVTSPNIKQLASAPFIGAKLPAVLQLIQQGTPTFAQDTSGSANTVTIALDPVPTALVNGQRVAVKIANSVTGPTVMNTNGLGNVSVVTTSLAALSANAMVANGIYTLVYDANGTRWQLQGFTAATATGLLPMNNLSDVSNAATSRNNLGAAAIASPTFTGTPSAPTAAAGTSTTQLATTAFVQNNSAVHESFTSSPQAITTAGGLTIAHGLSAAPSLLWTYLVCQTAEYGWSVGDKYLVSFGGPYGGTSTTAEGAAVSFDATNVYVRWSNDVPLNNLMNKNTGGYAALTNANWKLVVKALA